MLYWNLQQSESQPLPLIHLVHEDDIKLLSSPDAEWFEILYNFPWEKYRIHGAEYYDALYEFNQRERQKREEGINEQDAKKIESKEEAKMRLLFDRVTMRSQRSASDVENSEGEKDHIIYEGKVIELKQRGVDPANISPGAAPIRVDGKKPKCFFGLLKSFIGASLMSFPPEPDVVHQLLTSNPSFVRVCGFAPKDAKDEYCYLHIPSLRKLEQYDQIMREWGIWGKIKVEEVKDNIESGVIKKEKELVADTTHYHAYSGFETITYIDSNGKEQKKSQSKVTKKCDCKDKESCTHPWELSDDGAGTIVKSNKKMYWGHKASIIGYPGQGIPLDAAAISDASTFDGETLYPHMKKLFKNIPEVKPNVIRILYDSACDNVKLKRKLMDDFGIELKTSFNPRAKKEVVTNLPRGIEKITPYGSVICIGGRELDYKGIRYKNEKFIYQAPQDNSGASVCLTCEERKACSPNSADKGRMINIPFDLLPHINKNDPPMAKRFKAIMSRRPSVERMIKRLKRDLSDDRLTKRGNDSFQAYLDKTMIAYHILLRY